MKKRFDFITHTNIINKTTKPKRIFIDIGIISLIIALVLELFIGQKFGIIFIIPLLYLIKSRNQFSDKKIFGNVPVLIIIDDECISIKYQNVYYDKKKMLSLMYFIFLKDISEMLFSEKRSVLFIHYNGIEQMIDENERVYSEKNKTRDVLELYIPQNISKEIINVFNCINNVISID